MRVTPLPTLNSSAANADADVRYSGASACEYGADAFARTTAHYDPTQIYAFDTVTARVRISDEPFEWWMYDTGGDLTFGQDVNYRARTRTRTRF